MRQLAQGRLLLQAQPIVSQNVPEFLPLPFGQPCCGEGEGGANHLLVSGSGSFEATSDDFCPDVSYPLVRGQCRTEVSIKLSSSLINLPPDCDFLGSGL